MFRTKLLDLVPPTVRRFHPCVEALEDRTLATVTTLTVTPTRVNVGQSIILTAVVSDGTISSSGTVQFFDRGLLIGQVNNVNPIGGNPGTAIISVVLGAGVHTLTASYGNDVLNSSSTSGTVLVVVGQTRTTVTNVTGRVRVILGPWQVGNVSPMTLQRRVTLVNTTDTPIGGPFFLLARWPSFLKLKGKTGLATSPGLIGLRFLRVNLGQLAPGQSFTFTLEATGTPPRHTPPIFVYAGPGPV
jgi:hypothetical protein